MAMAEEVLSQLRCRFAVLLPHLNERQRRLTVAAEARLLGHGGVRVAAQVAEMSETTVRRVSLWRSAWSEFVPFLDYDVEIRKVICSTNAIESLNARYRRARSRPAGTSRPSRPP